MADRVALVACSAVTALAADLAGTMRALIEGRSGLAPIVAFDAGPFGSPVAAQVAPPEPPAAPEGSTRVDTPHGRLLEICARRVHDDAGFGEVEREALGFFTALPVVDSEPRALATAIASSRDATGALDLRTFFETGFRSIYPLWPLQTISNIALGQAAADLDVRGDNTVFSSGADAGVRAVAEAAGAIVRAELAAALVVGVGDHVSPGALARAKVRAVPGEVLGEGAGGLALESEASAARRGRVPVGFVGGFGFAFERSPYGPGPSSDAIVRAALAALAEAGRAAADVALLLVEGTSAEEAAARRELFGARGAAVAVVAPAMAIGHLRAGAAVVGAALAAAMLAVRTAPSSAHGRPRSLPPGGVALVLASGAAGAAAALVIEGVR